METSEAAPRVPKAGYTQPRWLSVVVGTLVLAGLAISSYLAVVHYNNDVVLVCSKSATIDCESVTTSKFSELAGVPLPVLGLLFFLALGVLNLPFAIRSSRPLLRWGRLACVVAGVLFVVYLVAAEIILGKICLWCTAIHVLTVLLFVLVLTGELRRIADSPQ
ncbi:hypothetical protein GCM10010149_45060 [Nonomuraea roseoviolacea subsp. roseoviolacea]|uniref:Membrane protein n=1 Tax=Nonomuraea roseoviolacea subsp. carminata TaxID=160689 RepID=A0ABT1JZ99_9ACTN|nr:vitamin K epoxide reductase family protein [Nonomuraea roseoviolacea]MCP2347066.1 putative membrane protein [Nonomuraea roseoviolacea subsp. carminata]